VGRRGRQREKQLVAPSARYRDDEGNVLELRGSLTPGARREYARVIGGGLDREDAWQRSTELLFERLAVSWTIAGLEINRQKELLGRYRMASRDERQFVRESLRAHLREHFPELEAP
jgi:hypothetical protein